MKKDEALASLIRLDVEAMQGFDDDDIRQYFRALREKAGHGDSPLRLKIRTIVRRQREERGRHAWLAAIREVYIACLSEEDRARIRPDSLRRAGDPNA